MARRLGQWVNQHSSACAVAWILLVGLVRWRKKALLNMRKMRKVVISVVKISHIFNSDRVKWVTLLLKHGTSLTSFHRRMDFPEIDYSKVAKVDMWVMWGSGCFLGGAYFGWHHQGIKFSDADFLKMLINLVGDLHQLLVRRLNSRTPWSSRLGIWSIQIYIFKGIW